MLPRQLRLPYNRISYVLKHGGRKQTEFFNICFIPSREKASQFAIIVPKKVSKLATVRNRNKRLLREAIRNFLKSVNPGEYVLFVKKDLSILTQKHIEEKLKQIHT